MSEDEKREKEVDKLASIFGVGKMVDAREVVPQECGKTVIVPSVIEIDSRKAVLKDFETARENLLEIIESGQQSIAELTQLCSQSQNDKYYAALSSLMKTVTDANEKLLTLQEKIREIENLVRNEPKQVTNQLILTTSELQKLIKNQKEQE